MPKKLTCNISKFVEMCIANIFIGPFVSFISHVFSDTHTITEREHVLSVTVNARMC